MDEMRFSAYSQTYHQTYLLCTIWDMRLISFFSSVKRHFPCTRIDRPRPRDLRHPWTSCGNNENTAPINKLTAESLCAWRMFHVKLIKYVSWWRLSLSLYVSLGKYTFLTKILALCKTIIYGSCTLRTTEYRHLKIAGGGTKKEKSMGGKKKVRSNIPWPDVTSYSQSSAWFLALLR